MLYGNCVSDMQSYSSQYQLRCAACEGLGSDCVLESLKNDKQF